MSKSEYVCARCGVACGSWREGWKHFTGGTGQRSCRQPPVPIRRQEYEAAELKALAKIRN